MNAADRDTARTAVEQHDKRVASMKARAALVGFELHIVSAAGGGSAFTIGRWGRTLDLPDVHAVELFLERAGAPR